MDALKADIASANANGENDTIKLAPNGTYTLFTADNSTNGGNGLPVIGADGGNSLTFAGQGATIQPIPISPHPISASCKSAPGASSPSMRGPSHDYHLRGSSARAGGS